MRRLSYYLVFGAVEVLLYGAEIIDPKYRIYAIQNVAMVVAALTLAYFYPDIIPGFKGIVYKNPLKFLATLMIIICVSLVIAHVSLQYHLDWLRLADIFLSLLIISVMGDNFPEDKWRSAFSSDKVKELVKKVQMIHNVPKPSVT